jgi:anti-anti-sigma factor
MLKVSSQESGGLTVVSLVGNLDGGPSSEVLITAVKEHLAAGRRRFVMDMAGLKWMNSAGIQALISVYASVRRQEGSMALQSPNDRVMQILTTSMLIPTVFELVDESTESISGTG